VTDEKQVPDLLRFPELRWLDTYHWIAPLLLAIGCGLIGGTSGLIVGFAWSTVAVWHATFCINSLAHVYGSRRYPTSDDSRNNWWLAILTMGEGWHNNHHHMMGSTRQGFFWWEIDLSYYILRALALGHVVWNLKQPPKHVIAER
jgi:stearoyl-CoA desaturase (delta-9 desaturase)